MEQHTYSLVSILRNDPDLGQRFIKKVKEVEEDKKALLSNAEKYNKQFEEEIIEGTKKKQLLIAEGAAKGLNEEQINWGGSFLPTVRTPILNFLYFILRDQTGNADEKIEMFRKEYNEYSELEHKDYKYEDIDANLLYAILRESNLSNEEVEQIKTTLNQRYGHLQDDYEIENSETKTPESMDELIYGEMTHDVFKKIKKLKSLSKSSNESEAFAAYRKCLEMCRKFGLDFDKIPCNIKE